MKTTEPNYRLFILLLVLTAVIGSAASNGVAEEQNKDRTGSPDGSTTCAQCHNSGYFNLFVNITIEDENGQEVTSYQPGVTYDLRFMMFTLAGPSASAYGFQTTALFSDLSDAGTFSDPGTNVQLEEVSNDDIPSRHVAEHSQPNPSGIFNVKWTAPSIDTGDVTFYYSATAVDLDEDNSGDNGMNGTLILTPLDPNAIGEPSASLFHIYWTANGLMIDRPSQDRLDKVRIFDLSGRLLWQGIDLDTSHPIQINGVEGIVLIEVQSGDRMNIEKLWVGH